MTFHQVPFSASLNMRIQKAVILTLLCSVCLGTESELVYFTSRNFNNTLHWVPAVPAVPGENITAKYSVEYKIHADLAEFQKKAGCQNITELFCDLTEETLPTSDGHYWARVFANGKQHASIKTRFTPITHTILGPPILSTNATASALRVHAILPMGPNGESIGVIIARSNNRSPETQVSYTLNITNPKWAQQKKSEPDGQFLLKLKPNTTYCGYVFYKLTYKPGRQTSEKAYFCEKLPAEPLNYLPWLLLTAVCLLALVILSLVCTCKYVNVGKNISLPSNLIITKTPTKVLLPQNETINISELRVYPQNVKRGCSSVQIKPGLPSVSLGGYSPQDLPWQIFQDSSVDTAALSMTSDSTSAWSSVSYSAVLPREPAEDQGAFNMPEISNKLPFPGAECESHAGMASVTVSHPGPPLCVQDCLESDLSRPLVLRTAQNSEGILVLPFWSSQFQSSPVNHQRIPLLSDLKNTAMEQPSLPNLDDAELSDGGDGMLTAPTQTHDSCYTQSHTVIPALYQGGLTSPSIGAGTESCYKQNWIPKVNIDTVSMHSDGDRTDYQCSWSGLRKEDGEAKEEREELKGSQLIERFLGNWLLEIQD